MSGGAIVTETEKRLTKKSIEAIQVIPRKESVWSTDLSKGHLVWLMFATLKIPPNIRGMGKNYQF